MLAFVEESKVNRSAGRLKIGLGVLQVFIGLAAVGGGIGLVSDPSGANLSFRLEWLARSPFSNYLIPGFTLLVVNGLGNLVGSVLSFTGKWIAGEIGAALGLFMVAWIAVQVYWIGLSYWLQPLFLGLGMLEVVLGIWLRKNLRSTSVPQESRGCPGAEG